MRLLIVDPPGHGLSLAIRAQKAGHDVKHAIKEDPKTKHIGRGFVELVRDYREWLRWADLVVMTDNLLYMQDMARYRSEGGLVLGATPETARWETDRKAGQEIFRRAGIATIPGKLFNDYDEAIRYVKKTDKRYVSKPNGEADKALSYVSNGPADMVYMLERWKRLNKLKEPFLLQEFVKGIEMGAAGWFGPDGWVDGWEETFEFKKLMDGDSGPATGEQGTVMRFVRKSKLASEVVEPITRALREQHYVGDLAVNCIIDEQGRPWPLEFTTRLGWPAFNIQMSLLKDEDPVSWMYDLVRGSGRRLSPFALNTIAVGVVLSVPDYPYSHMTRKEVVGIPVYGLKPWMWKHLHPCEMMVDTCPCDGGSGIAYAPVPCTAGDYVLNMTALGDTVQSARDLCYSRLARIKKEMPGSPMYRTDIGNRLSKQLPELHRHGYAKGLLFAPPVVEREQPKQVIYV